MNNELSIIKRSLSHKDFLEISSLLSTEQLSKETQGLFRALASFHTSNPGHNLSVADLANLYTGTDKEYFQAVFDHLAQLEVSQDTTLVLCKKLAKASLLRSLAMQAYEASEGSEKSLVGAMEGFKRLSELDKEQEKTEEFEFTTQNLDELLGNAVYSKGLSWRLPSLNKYLGPLRKGDFGFIFARPETGKTTFLASEETFFCEQADGYVLHLNNEEQNDKVMLRMYQASTGCTLEQLYSNTKKYQEEFLKNTQGKFLMPKMGSSIHFKQIEKLCEKYKPSLVVIDQIDKVLGLDNDREDLRLGAIYQRTRELAKDTCPFIGVCQADGTGEGQKWLTMSHVANAKTSKQAEADWILGIGKLNDPGYDILRFFNISKNKLMGSKDTDATKRHMRWETIIKPEIARYADI